MSALPSIERPERAVLGADAAGALYERHSTRIFAFCLSRLGNREEAEDATQTTFLNAFRSLHGGLEPRFEIAWLFRIADNVCRDRRKSAWRRGRLETTQDLQELQDVVSAPERRPEGLVGLEAALAAMPERQRRAILLREWQGLSYDEIARELGLSKAAVETLIFRARRSLARGLETPPQRRARAGLDFGWFLGLAKALLQGGGAVKVAATVAAVAGAGLVATAPLGGRSERPPAPAPRTTSDAPTAREMVPHSTSNRVAPAAKRTPAARRAVSAHRSTEAASPRSSGGHIPPAATATDPTPAPASPDAAAGRPAATPPASPKAEPATEAPAASTPAPPPPSSLPTLPDPPAVPPAVPPVPPIDPPAVPPPPDLPVDVPPLPRLS